MAMKIGNVRVIKKNRLPTAQTKNSESRKSASLAPTTKNIKNNINSWVSELRLKKDLQMIESFNLLADATR